MTESEVKVGDGDSLKEGFCDGAHVDVPPHVPKDPRSKYKYNILCRLLFM